MSLISYKLVSKRKEYVTIMSNRMALYLNCTPEENAQEMDRIGLNREVVQRQGAILTLIEKAEKRLVTIQLRLEKRQALTETHLAIPSASEAFKLRSVETTNRMVATAEVETVRLKAQIAEYRRRLKALKVR
jgi:hypothetical protein